jgi:hypothetical protein
LVVFHFDLVLSDVCRQLVKLSLRQVELRLDGILLGRQGADGSLERVSFLVVFVSLRLVLVYFVLNGVDLIVILVGIYGTARQLERRSDCNKNSADS